MHTSQIAQQPEDEDRGELVECHHTTPDAYAKIHPMGRVFA